MPAAVVGAGISAAGSVAGGIASGKGASKAAKIQAQEEDKQIAATQQYQAANEARYAPDVAAGNSALGLYDDAIGTGTDPNAAATALSAFQNSTGYKTTLGADLAATNASAYASGLGKSGAALGALADRGAYDANQSYQSWLGNLQTPIAVGTTAKAALAGVSENALNSTNAATSNAANAASTAAIANGATTSNVLQQLAGLGSTAYNSSYAPISASSGAAQLQQPYGISVMSGYTDPLTGVVTQ